MPSATAATCSIWLKVRLSRVWTLRGFHNRNTSGKDTIKWPKKTLSNIRRDDDMHAITLKLSVGGVGRFSGRLDYDVAIVILTDEVMRANVPRLAN